MHYFFEDLAGLAAATLLAALLIVLPGFGLLQVADRFGISPHDKLKRGLWALVLGPVLLPAVDALLLRWAGMTAVLAPHAILAALGAMPAFAAARRLTLGWWLALFGIWAAVAWANVDFDWGGRLYQSLSVFDTVKHGTVVAALATRGVPFGDPFFAREGITGYYYYFYIGPALIRWLAHGFLDNRAAFGAGTVVTLMAFPAMLMLLADRAALIVEGTRKRFARLLAFLCCVQGLDLIPGLVIWGASGITIKQLETWNPEVRWVLSTTLWVPHHITAVMAVFAGCLILTASRGSVAIRAAVAALAFATAFGCSVWVSVAAAIVLPVWWLVERGRSASLPFWALPLSGAIAALLLIPQFHDLIVGRTSTVFPLAFTVHGIGPDPGEPKSIVDGLVRLALIPFAYLVAYGIFAAGAFMFFRHGGLARARATAMGRLMLCAVPVALLLATFGRSTIIYNDFSWRTMWFAQVPVLLWAVAYFNERKASLWKSPILGTCLALGLAATAYDVIGLRIIRAPYFTVSMAVVNAHPEVDYELRAAYRWIDANLPEGMIVQHNPADLRGIDFGLYGDRPVAMSDFQARLFGAEHREVLRRGRVLRAIYERPLPLEDVRRRAVSEGAGAVLLTSADRLWKRGNGPPRDWTCAYRSPRTCIMVVESAK